MFILTKIKDLIPLPTSTFHLSAPQALKDAINTKYANKIIPSVGLCICLYDLTSSSEGLIGHGTGLVNIACTFRLLVFRPFRGEIIYGKIKSSNPEGVTVDLEFTSEVFVPWQLLFDGSNFDAAEGCFVWRNEDQEFFFDRGEHVLIRVEQEEWTEQQPGVVEKDNEGNEIEEKPTVWRIIGSMNQAGLGPQLWWNMQAQAVGEVGEREVDMEDSEE